MSRVFEKADHSGAAILATQVAATVVEVIGSGSVAPVNVALPAAAVVLNDNGEFIPDLERFEGMLVTFPDTLTVTELFNLDRFGEVHLAAGGRPLQFTNDNAPSVAGFEQHLREIGARHVMLDDGQTVQNPDPIRYLGPGQANGQPDVLRLGATVTGLTGTLRFGRGSGGSGDPLYRLNPTTGTVTFGDGEGSQRPPAGAPLPGARYRYRYASVNVLNFFTTLDVPGNTCGPSGLDCRGANSQAEFDRQFAKLVTTLLELDADVVGLVELENNAAASLATIVDALNAELGAGTWGYVDTGVIGGDAIKVGLIYDTTTTAALGDFAILDSSVDVRFIDTKNRPVLAQTFQDLATAGVVTVAVNHLKSKGSPCDDVGDPNAGDGQGNCNGTRTLAAEAMIDWLAGDPTGSGDPDVLVLGDLNAYLREDPVQAFRDAGWTNLLDVFIGPGAYSFAFDRQIGALDHAIATPSLAAQVTGTVEWHINADEPDAIDYNLDFGRNPGIFDGAIPFRSSDHDPVVVGLELTGDLDGDGVADDIDVCPATIIPEATVPSRRLIGRRYALVDDDTVFDKASRFGRTYTTADTAGCSCEQIIEATVPGWFGWLNRKYGCSNGLMRWWVRSVSH
ncbi:MAG: ExeM/NucH family extracellular endonuclease [Pseudomonadota bacterium]